MITRKKRAAKRNVRRSHRPEVRRHASHITKGTWVFHRDVPNRRGLVVSARGTFATVRWFTWMVDGTMLHLKEALGLVPDHVFSKHSNRPWDCRLCEAPKAAHMSKTELTVRGTITDHPYEHNPDRPGTCRRCGEPSVLHGIPAKRR